MERSFLDGLSEWANVNAELAYAAGFLIIAAMFYALFPFQIALSCATSKDIPFKNINVARQLRKRHRLAFALASILTFSFLLFVMNLPELALIAGGVITAALVATDYAQIYGENAKEL